MKPVLLLLIALLMNCKGKTTDGVPLCPPRNNESMSDFILKSAQETWPLLEIRMEDGNTPISTEQGDEKVHYKNLLIGTENQITIFLCRNATETAWIKERELSRAAGKDPYRAPLMAQYGNLLMTYWGLNDNGSMHWFLHSVTLDTRHTMQKARNWQQWLSRRGIPAEIPKNGFSLRNTSVPSEIDIPYQTLSCVIGGHQMELLCFSDPATAAKAHKELVHLTQVCDPIENADVYIAYGPYGNVLIMSSPKSESEDAASLITEFWSVQSFN